MEEKQDQEIVEDIQAIDEQEEVHTEVEEEVIEEKTYSQAEVDTLQEQINELSQYKPKDLTEQEVQLQEKLDSIWKREVNATLKEEGIEVFADFIQADVDDTDALHKQITKLKEIVGALEISNGYQPSNHKPVDGFALAKKNNDSIGMIKNKLKF